MSIAEKINTYMEKASWIRKMFEQGLELKSRLGADKVFDFSLGNPNVEPPDQVRQALLEVIQDRKPGQHAYMPNAGYRETREAVARFLSNDHGIEILWEQVVMTCGAGGGLNVSLRTLVDPGDEVIVLSPYFVEYFFYIDNHSGIGRLVCTNEDFTLNLEAIDSALGPKSKALILNSPNNPTGRVYDEKSLRKLGEILRAHSQKYSRDVFLLSDEPYSKLVYDGIKVPSIFKAYSHSLLITSYSKDLSLPGERIGFVAANPAMKDWRQVVDGLTFCNRTLGFVNAPAIMQHILPRLQGISIDVGIYRRKRDQLCKILAEIGYRFTKPQGAFYLFPKSPQEDDVAFVQTLLQENILAVPGKGFGAPGYFRLAYCVEDRVIEGSIEGFKRAFEKSRT
jgi:aspartate aminotransferase